MGAGRQLHGRILRIISYIHDVMRANGMNQAMIYEGQLLIIPCEGDVAENTDGGAGEDMKMTGLEMLRCR
ncbi:MAG: hypothetical protein ACLR5Q_04335 [Coprococcus sp.]